MSELAQFVRRRCQLRRAGVLVAVVALTCLPGCVQRRMTIRSNPPGALVYIDNNEIGVTPVSTSFIYYGTREIRLVKDGCETLTVLQPMWPPWYQIPPLDFFSENLVPGELRDQRTFTYQLRPQVVVPSDQLIQRAEGLRSAAQAPGGVMNAPITPLPAPPIAGPDGTIPPASLAPPPVNSGGVPVQPVAPYGWSR
ncbi:MAG: PEGA domain-containing protein [Thermoguttaceae bacterium]|jgi:hypothetical protein